MRWEDDVGTWEGVSPRVVLDYECGQRDLRPQLVKIYAEGAELDVIRGMECWPPVSRRCCSARSPTAGTGPIPPWIQLLGEAGYGPSAIDEERNLGPLGELHERTTQNVLFRRLDV